MVDDVGGENLNTNRGGESREIEGADGERMRRDSRKGGKKKRRADEGEGARTAESGLMRNILFGVSPRHTALVRVQRAVSTNG